MFYNINKIETLLASIFFENQGQHLHELLCEVAVCNASFTQQVMSKDDRIVKIKVKVYHDGIRCEICNGNDAPMVFYLEE